MATKSLRIERLLGGMRTDLAGLLRRQAAGFTLAVLVSDGTTTEQIARLESSIATYERMLAAALREELAALSSANGLASIEVAS